MKPAPGSSESAKLPKKGKAGQWPLDSEPAGSSRSESENRFTVVGPVAGP